MKFIGMKRVSMVIALLCMMGMPHSEACAQTRAIGGLVPENGFWELIFNESGPAGTTIKFFNLQEHLIYEEHLDGVRLDARRRKICRLLNRSLRTALAAWEKNKMVMKDRGIVAVGMR